MLHHARGRRQATFPQQAVEPLLMGFLINIFAVAIKEAAFLTAAEILVNPAVTHQCNGSRFLPGTQQCLDLAGCAVGCDRGRAFEPCQNFVVGHGIGHGFFGALAKQSLTWPFRMGVNKGGDFLEAVTGVWGGQKHPFGCLLQQRIIKIGQKLLEGICLAVFNSIKKGVQARPTDGRIKRRGRLRLKNAVFIRCGLHLITTWYQYR